MLRINLNDDAVYEKMCQISQILFWLVKLNVATIFYFCILLINMVLLIA